MHINKYNISNTQEPQIGVSIVIPAYNEEKAIADTVATCRKMLENFEAFEIIVVNDASSDATAQIAQNAGARVIHHPVNGGYGRSIKDGIRAATYDTIVILDADGTYPIEDITKLLEKYFEGFDMVVGARAGTHYIQSKFKSCLRSILKFMVEWSCGKSIPDINSGFRVFSKNESLRFFNHLCDTFSFTTSLTLAYMMTGRFVGYVPTQYYPRIGSSHVRLFTDSLNTLNYVLRQILYFNPIKIFTLFAICWLLFGVFWFVCFTILHLLVGYYLGILSLFGACIMFGLGLLAEQIRQLILSGEHNIKK